MISLKDRMQLPYKHKKHMGTMFTDENGEFIPGRTEQCHKDLCDIRNVIKTFDANGVFQHVSKAKAHYGDYTVVNEYQENLNMITEAQQDFDQLPSKIRRQFQDDPGTFLEFISDPKNATKMVEMDLAIKVDLKEKPIEVKVVETTTKKETKDE